LFFARHVYFCPLCIFCNQDDFKQEVERHDHPDTTIFTGYDCDSLALESVTQFATNWLPYISKLKSLFEFRTKSVAIRPFLEHLPLENCVVAYTLTPQCIGKEYEHKTPSLEKRLQAIEALQAKGWKVGLRFDPIIYCLDYKNIYQTFFKEVFNRVFANRLHSVTLGAFRVPPQLFKRMVSLYPKEPLFAQPEEWHARLLDFCQENILNFIPRENFFPCYAKDLSCNRC
jgi:spore photoproduct lyase